MYRTSVKQFLQVNELLLVPPVAVMLAKSGLAEKFDLSCVEEVLCGGAPLSSSVEKQLRQCLGLNLHIRQGM